MALTPFLMFIGKAEEAMRFYVGTFPDAEILDAPTKPVELPDDERVALPENVERLLESRTVGDLPAHRVVEDLDASGACQRLVLNVETLVLGRDTGVADAHC
jgi:hypothetical protein